MIRNMLFVAPTMHIQLSDHRCLPWSRCTYLVASRIRVKALSPTLHDPQRLVLPVPVRIDSSQGFSCRFYAGATRAMHNIDRLSV